MSCFRFQLPAILLPCLVYFVRRAGPLNSDRTVFSQLLDFLPRYEFNQCMQRYATDEYRVRSFSYFDQFLCMTFAQLTFRESLRDIETCLRSMDLKLYHCGLRGKISRSTLADANEQRSWQSYADFAQVLIRIARKLYEHENFGVVLNQTAYVLDSTLIDLCSTLFPWARYQRQHSAIKLHTLLDLKGNIPCVVALSEGRMHDVKMLDELIPESGSFYIMDRGYIDFARLAQFPAHSAHFIIRAKRNLSYKRGAYYKISDAEHAAGLRCDQMISLRYPAAARDYPYPLRYVSYYTAKTNRRFTFLTDDIELPGLIVARLYECRWQVELFFKWIKQHLRIKAFYGTSENAVRTQIWIAISTYVLIAIVKKQLRIEHSFSEIQQILSIALFEKESLYQRLTNKAAQNEEDCYCNQLSLW
jgi:transposase